MIFRPAKHHMQNIHRALDPFRGYVRSIPNDDIKFLTFGESLSNGVIDRQGIIHVGLVQILQYIKSCRFTSPSCSIMNPIDVHFDSERDVPRRLTMCCITVVADLGSAYVFQAFTSSTTFVCCHICKGD